MSSSQDSPSNKQIFLLIALGIGNQYREDNALQEILQRILPVEVVNKIEVDLEKFGTRVITDVLGISYRLHMITLSTYLYKYGKRC